MNFHRKMTPYITFLLAIAFNSLFAQSSSGQALENQQIVVEGSLTDNSGNAIDLSGETLVFYISTSAGCYLYGETTTSAGDSQGNILHRIGSSAVVSGSPNGFSQNLFYSSASGTTTFGGNNCSVTASDVRLVEVYYSAQNIRATMKLGTVPYANNAQLLSGKSASEFLSVTTDSNTLFYSGTSGQILTRSASGFAWQTPSVTSAQVTAALGYTPASATAGITSSSIAATLGYTPASATALNNYALRDNNLSDLASATIARSNLGLNTLATKSFIFLQTEVSGTLPVANGGSQWLNVAGNFGISYPGNIGIGSGSVPTNARMYLEATPAVSIAAIIKNTDVNGHGLKIDMAGASGNQFGLHVKAGGSTVLMAQNDGLIGIGTAAPTTALNIVNDNGSSNKDDIQVDTFGSGTSALSLRKAKGTAAAPTQLIANDPIGNLRWDGYTGSSYANLVALTGYAETNLATSVNSYFTISTTSGGAMTERVRVTANGNVGIGITNPSFTLDVSGTIATMSDVNSKIFLGRHSVATPYAYVSTRTVSSGLILQSRMFDNTTVDSLSIAVPTTNYTGLRVDPTGNIGIGTTSPGYKLDVSGTINIASGSALAFGGTSVCTAAGCTSSSDERLKENIKPLDFDLNKLLSLNAVQYDWKNKSKYGDKHQIGFIAQNLEQVYPEVVYTDKNTGLKSVTYGHLVAPIIEALKSLYKRILGTEDHNAAQDRQIASIVESKADKEELEVLKQKATNLEAKAAKVDKLESENAELKMRLDKIEKALNSK